MYVHDKFMDILVYLLQVTDEVVLIQFQLFFLLLFHIVTIRYYGVVRKALQVSICSNSSFCLSSVRVNSEQNIVSAMRIFFSSNFMQV